MKPLPLPLRIAAGLVATAVEQARELPRRAVEFPVTAVSQALQASMRVQQTITELAIKGDRALGALRPVEEKPSWATFDEDLDDDHRPANGVTPLARPGDRQRPGRDGDTPAPAERHRPEPERIPVARPPAARVETITPEPPEPVDATAGGPNVLPGYAAMSIAALRARLRNLSIDDLHTLLEWENAHEARPPFVTMLTNRIATVSAP
ncbi:MAG: lipid droplet-associated protein [Pseudonocardia sp.]